MRGHRPVGSIGALLVAATLVLSSCTGGDDDAASTTNAPSSSTSTIPTYDLTNIAPGPLGDLAECDGAVGTVGTILEGDLSAEHPGDELIVAVDCEGTDLDRILLLSGTNNAATLLSEPVVAIEPQLIGVDPVRLVAYQPDGEWVLQTVYRWDEGRLRAMSEAILDLDEYLEAIGAATEPPLQPLSRADLFDQASPAVVSLEGITCGGNQLDAGTGFIVSPDLVVTAAHVVEDYERMIVRLIDGSERPGETIGFAPGQDTALVRLSEPVSVTPLEWSDQTPRVGSDITVLGYPLNLDLSVTAGTISGVGRTILFPNGEQIPNVLQTDALTNPGNSGGPWLDETGRVIGLHIAGRDGAAGINWGVAADVVQALTDQWASEPQPYQPCTPPEEFLVRIDAERDEADALAELFSDYAGGITTGDFELAYQRLWNPTVPAATWSADLATSTWSGVAIVGIDEAPADRVEEFGLGEVNSLEVRVSATTHQAPRFGPDGLECANWDLVYLVASIDGVFWQIVSSAGSEHTAC